jgi:succinyl-diaminopimelate desuccinylase
MKILLKKLIQAKTTAKEGELAAAQIISAEFDSFGIDSRIDTWDTNRANITARIKSTGQAYSAEAAAKAGKRGLLFACHLDVVGPGEAIWQKNPFGAVESDGKIYGRGATDMKGAIASIVTAICRIVESGTKLQGDIMFFAAAGEETDSCGTKRFIRDYAAQLPGLAGVVITEPTDFAVVTAHRGMLWLRVTTRGKAAHSSTPQLGINAISSMKSFLDELQNYKLNFEPHKLLGNCSMSINTISGGKEINVVPDSCSIEIDIRTLPSQSTRQIIDDFEGITAKLKQKNPEFDAEITLLREVEALETDNNCDFVKKFCSAVGVNGTKAVGFTTDGPYFASLGAPVVIFGPGKPELAHKPDEYIDFSDVEKAVELYKKIILRFLA